MSAVPALEPHLLPTAQLREELRRRLPRRPDARDGLRIGHYAGIDTLRLQAMMPRTATRAAVLVPIVDRGDNLTVLLTLRADSLAHHAGQIAFPGGRLEPADADATDAALREAEEEIGLSRERVEVIGFLPDHAVISGFRVTPVVGLVRAGFELRLDPKEVAGTFEAPLRHLLDPATHTRSRRSIAGQDIETFELPWGSFNIWGATAGMLLTLREALGVPVHDGD
jgi:8-oxo-dGTP pyrophosphatase MutT (NUDIX family)